MQGLKLNHIISAPENGPTFTNARPPAGTAIIIQFHIFPLKILWLSMISYIQRWPEDIQQNGRRDLENTHS